jgi:hypothetical protein
MNNVAPAGGFFVKTQPHLIPIYQQQALRNAFAIELCLLREKSGYKDDIPGFAARAGVSTTLIKTMEGAHRTDESVTLHTLHKIATAHSAEVIPERDHVLAAGSELYCGATTTLETLWSMGVHIRFSTE